MNADTGACFQLNRVGADLWSHFAAAGSVQTAVELLRARYGTTEDQSESDVNRLCADMVQAGLLVVVPQSEKSDSV
jgi:hypothetical protein